MPDSASPSSSWGAWSLSPFLLLLRLLRLAVAVAEATIVRRRVEEEAVE